MSEHERESAIAAYDELDVSAGSELRDELLRHLDAEAQDARLKLTDPFGPGTSNLTGGMLAWYQGSIRGRRDAALRAIADAFRDIAANRNAGGVFLDRDLQQVQIDLAQTKRDLKRSQQDQHSTLHKALADMEAMERRLEREFNELRDKENNRPPRILNWALYGTVLLAISISEMMLNFETFNSLNFFTPFIASAFALLIGAGLAFAAHLHGTLFKQLEYYTGVKERDSKRWAAWQVFGLGTLALTTVLTAVGYARSQYLADYLTTREMLGGGGDTDAFWVIGGSLLGNVIVWIVGVIFAYILHDRNPDYPEKAVELNRATTKRRRLEARLEGPVRREIERAEAAAADASEKLKAADRAQRGAKGYREAQAYLGRLISQDGRVIAALSAYRTQLRSQNKIDGAQVLIPAAGKSDEYDTAPLSDYGHYDLELKLV
ncbi:hypothetical protein [Maricaulis maris]|uniref:Uncharacterized protein n=1 Tax=Maricaulis maris TaxID=74318 RepID=A0A495DDS3_9PROT|nr:hypothetical protein [Maricaulis maris]RKR00441.1 hypothetical protein C7435_1649 [Maricaulis maris]